MCHCFESVQRLLTIRNMSAHGQGAETTEFEDVSVLGQGAGNEKYLLLCKSLVAVRILQGVEEDVSA